MKYVLKRPLSKHESMIYINRCFWDVYEDSRYIGTIEYDDRYGKKCFFACLGGKTNRGSFATFVAAKKRLYDEDIGECNPTKQKTSTFKAKYLPSGDNADFYPTPSKLAGEMLSRISWGRTHGVCEIRTVLEPSAGKGDLIDAFRECAKKKARYSDDINVDCIESDRNLQYLLRGKGEHLVHDDFLTFDSRKRYDLILMNPPFSQGDKHLLKAIEMQRNGGQIVCLLNAETLRNTYTNTRYLLEQKLRLLHADIRYVKGAFTAAERKTGVEIAIVYLNIPSPIEESDIYEKLRKAKNIEFDEKGQPTAVAAANPIKNLMQTYDFEVDMTLEFFHQYNALLPYITDKTKCTAPLISIGIQQDNFTSISNVAVNKYLKTVRKKYWGKLFDNPKLTEQFTSNILANYRQQVEDLANYDFTEFNIVRVLDEMKAQLNQGVESAIIALFDKLSCEHAWYPECKQNRHYFNGWKTNNAHMVGMKAIIPMNGYASVYSRYSTDTLDVYHCVGTLSDLEKSLNYLNNDNITELTEIGLQSTIDTASKKGVTKNICCKYFSITLYKKGTCHIKFHPEAKPLIERLNIFAAQQRGWLPPSYGKTSYKDMDSESRAVIDNFQGEEAYDEVMRQPDKYLLNVGKLAMLTD